MWYVCVTAYHMYDCDMYEVYMSMWGVVHMYRVCDHVMHEVYITEAWGACAVCVTVSCVTVARWSIRLLLVVGACLRAGP